MGISLSVGDKIAIARRLDALRVDYVEGGWPGSNPRDARFFTAMRDEPLAHARVSAFGSTRHVGVRAQDDENLRLLVDCGAPVVALVAKAWDFHVDLVLRTTLEENVAMVRESVEFVKRHGREVVFDAEHFFDGYAQNRDYAGAGPGSAPVRVRITAAAPDGVTWTTVGSAPDLLHAAWLALAESLEYAVVAGAVEIEPSARPAPMPMAELAEILRPALAAEDRDLLSALADTDWRRTTLDLASDEERSFAARATALGAALFYSFGNFCAVAAHPSLESVRRVNLVKGRPVNQVGSITTTRTRYAALFDWAQLPDELERERVLALMDAFFGLGPMGFRGPAAPMIPDHLTSLDGATRTTQLIAPGYRCPSNGLLDGVLARAGEDYLFITSANVSSGVTGRVEAAHYDLAGMQADFGDSEGIVLIGHRDEAAVRDSYARHLPMSTSILAFHKLATDASGEPALVLERHGSLSLDDTRELVAAHGLALAVGEGAQERLPARDAALAR